jgi:glucan biosynthesis protein C
MESISSLPTPEGRRYDLDWLRAIAILILLYFHTGMLFNTWGWHIKNNETSDHFNYWMIWLHFWRMPLLLFISGAGTYMALGKRTPGQFVRERARRLIIPLIFGMLVIVPPQIYFEHIREYDGYWDFYKTVFQFVPYPKGSFSWHHLWFIAYLFFFSLLALPFLTFLRSSRSLRFRSGVGKVLANPMGLLLIPAIIILITQLLLRPYFPNETHGLVDDWAYFAFYFCFFLFGMTCYANPELWNAIGKNRRWLLMATLLILVPFYITYFHFRKVVQLPWTDRTVEIIFDVISLFLSWFTVVTVIAFGQHHLNRNHPILSRLGEGTYPFYILHQTVIISIGYYLCQLDWSIGAKFWAVSTLTLVSCLAFYFLVIRPFNIMRFLFGMKAKRRGL